MAYQQDNYQHQYHSQAHQQYECTCTSDVFFELETTGFHNPAITQIGAVGSPTMGEFNRYVIPTKPIELGASELTGLMYHNGKMYKFGEEVDAVSIYDALVDFINYIGNEKVLLVGHNSHRYDVPILRRVAASKGLLGHLQSRIVGVTDTLKIFRDINPPGCNKLESLIEKWTEP